MPLFWGGGVENLLKTVPDARKTGELIFVPKKTLFWSCS